MPAVRIKELMKFYVPGDASSLTFIDSEIPASKKLSEEGKGAWATDQFLAAAKAVFLEPFILERSHSSSYEVPALMTQGEYIKGQLEKRRNFIDDMESGFMDKQRRIDTLKSRLIKAEGALAKATGSVDSSAEELSELEEQIDIIYDKWNQEVVNLKREKLKSEEIKAVAVEKGVKQYQADTDAKKNLLVAMGALKKFLSSLIKKVPTIEEVVREAREDGADPYEKLDLRTVYKNLVKRYRSSSEMGVTTTLMIGMQSKQGNESLGSFIRSIEEFYQTVVNLGITQVSTADLCAMIAIIGMKDKHRTDFMKIENTLALAVGDGVGSDSESEDDGSTTISRQSGRKGRRSLWSKVKLFSKKESEYTVLHTKFTGNSKVTQAGDPGAASQLSSKEAQKRLKEAQQIFAMSLKKENNSICFEFAKDGRCSRGDACRFIHTIDPSATKPSGGGDHQPGECHAFKTTGHCNWGDKCKFRHVEPSKPSGLINNSGHCPSSGGSEQSGKKKATVSKVLFTKDENN